MKQLNWAMIVSAILLSACGGGGDPAPTQTTTTTTVAATTTTAATTSTTLVTVPVTTTSTAVTATTAATTTTTGATTTTTAVTVAGCTGNVATFFDLAKGSYTAALSTFDNATLGLTPATVAGFTKGTSYTVTVNANCTITVGSITMSYTNGSYFEFPGTGANVGTTQYDVDMTGDGLYTPHFERFNNGKRGLSFFTPAITNEGARLDE